MKIRARGTKYGTTQTETKRGFRLAVFSSICALAVMALAIFSSTALAGTNEWTGNGPPGGSISALVISPNFAADNTLFAGIYGGGMFKSIDGGGSWNPVNTGLSDLWIASLAISPNYVADSTVFTGTSSGIFKSIDGGATWSSANAGLPVDSFISTLTISPNFAKDHSIFVGTHNGIFKSTDGGGSWSPVNQLPIDAYSLAFSPNYDTDRTILVAAGNDSLFESKDGGNSWSQLNLARSIYSIAFSPNYSTDKTVFIAAGGAGVFKSSDGGVSWAAVNTGITLIDNAVSLLAISPGFATDQTIFAGTGAVLFESTDGGESWHVVNRSTPHSLLAISPSYASDSTIFSATDSGIFKSTNGGIDWSAANAGLNGMNVSSIAISPDFAADGTLFAGTQRGVFKLGSGGSSWGPDNTGLPENEIYSLAVSPDFSNDKTLFAAVDGMGVFKSSDGGSSWFAVNTGITELAVVALAISPNYASDHTIFVATDWEGVFKSTDGGARWSLVLNTEWRPDEFNGVLSIAISPSFFTDQTIFISRFMSGIYKSADGGASWINVNTRTGVESLAVSPNYDNDHTLFAGFNGIAKSIDGGTSWNNVATLQNVTSLAISPNFDNDGTLFAGTGGTGIGGAGVFRSTDSGGSWSAVNTGLRNLKIRSLAVSPNFANDNTLFIGTYGSSVWSYTFGASPDHTPPVVFGVHPNSTITMASTTINASFSDNIGGSGINNASAAIYLDSTKLSGCTVTGTSISCPVSGLSPGMHAICGSVADNAGNSSPISGSFAVSKNYFWTWYDNLGGDDWVMLANPVSASGNVDYALNLAGVPMDLGKNANGGVPPGQGIEPRFDHVGGPVKASSLTGAGALVSQRVLWPKDGSSLEEVPGTNEANLSSDYWWTWYDQTAGKLNWVMVANPGTFAAYYQISIAGGCAAGDATKCRHGSLAPAGDITGADRATQQFPDVIGGPVEVKGCSVAPAADGTCAGTPLNLIASQRVLSNGGQAFNEVSGTPASALSDDYLWTWYDEVSTGVRDWVMLANPSAAASVYYQISIAGGCAAGDAGKCQYGSLNAGGYTYSEFSGIAGGPVEVKGCSVALAADGTCSGAAEKLIASQRSIWGPSFEEVLGYPRASLASEYNWTWYDNNSPGVLDWVMVANPSATDAVHAVVSFTDTIGKIENLENDIAPGAHWNAQFPGRIGGPVKVTSVGGNVIASQRVLWKGYFNEVLGSVVG